LLYIAPAHPHGLGKVVDRFGATFTPREAGRDGIVDLRVARSQDPPPDEARSRGEHASSASMTLNGFSLSIQLSIECDISGNPRVSFGQIAQSVNDLQISCRTSLCPGVAWKACGRASVSRVRISPHPFGALVKIRPMIRSSTIQLLALVVGLGAALTGPAVSFAHGHAHSEAVEHATHHAPGAGVPDHPSVGAADHDQDHAHPRLEPSAVSRVLKDLPAMRIEVVTIALAEFASRETVDAPEPNESPPDRPIAAPAHSRAPPAL
jgi:hypothetical protein